ncbi:MAG: hypothetical protein ACON4G_07690 [Candidatus Puniceispirillaceae bacterium]
MRYFIFLIFSITACGAGEPHPWEDLSMSAECRAALIEEAKKGSRADVNECVFGLGKIKDADEIYIGVSAGIELETGDRFFKHFGFEYVGGNYKKRFERVKQSGGLHL